MRSDINATKSERQRTSLLDDGLGRIMGMIQGIALEAEV